MNRTIGWRSWCFGSLTGLLLVAGIFNRAGIGAGEAGGFHHPGQRVES